MASLKEVTAPRVPVPVVVAVVGVVLVLCCVVWARIAEVRVPDVCSDQASVPSNVGPYKCPGSPQK